MSLAIVHTRAQLGIAAPAVTVEAHLSNGLPGFTIVGLPETAVRESKDRVRSALINSHFEFPQHRITINLAPADLPKEGARFDLAIALGILAASDQIPKSVLNDYEFVGELALSGELRRIPGCISAAMASGEAKRHLVAPSICNNELALCLETAPNAHELLCADNLLQVCAHLHAREVLPSAVASTAPVVNYERDLCDVKGQEHAKRALEIAAGGGHNILLFGPPGTGKSMLASRLPSIMPHLSQSEALEVSAIQSLTRSNAPLGVQPQRPFRSPHHTASAVAMVGGGGHPKPGEISLAHNGVLFLDELPEYGRSVLEVLREPLESGQICISRAKAHVDFPARFQLVAAMNPCPCGYFGDVDGRCTCTPNQIGRYKDKISGPLLDRIDLQVQVNALPMNTLQRLDEGEHSEAIQVRVQHAASKQISRQGCRNSALEGKVLKKICVLGETESTLLTHAIEKLKLSARAYDRILRVSRTIADIEQADTIQSKHISEALSYRNFDRFYARIQRY